MHTTSSDALLEGVQVSPDIAAVATENCLAFSRVLAYAQLYPYVHVSANYIVFGN